MRPNLEATFTFLWSDNWEAEVQAGLTAWSDRIPAICPTHGEPAEKSCGWEPHCDHRLPAGTRVVLFQCSFAPCPVCRVVRAGVPPLFQRCSFDNFVADTDQLRDHLAKVREFAAAPTGFLLLLGTVGNGKTHLAAAILREFGRGRYFRHLDLVNRLRAAYARHHDDDDGDEPGIADQCREAWLLVVDELGVAPGGNDAETLLHDILDHRVTDYGPTVLCANLPAGELEANFGSRLADRFRHAAFAVLTFTDPSRRPQANAAYLEQARARTGRR